jgi:hypothetical protein
MTDDVVKRAVNRMVKGSGFTAQMDRGTIISVDKNAVTCVVQLVSNDAVLQNVLLKPIISEGDVTQLGLILFPAIGSFVTVAKVDDDNTDIVVVDITIIESISLDTNTALKLLITVDGKLSLNAVQTTFNNGQNGGIPLLMPLIIIINRLQQNYNDLALAFTSHIHPVAGAATGPTATPAPAQITPLTQPADIANKIISQ